MLKFLKTLDIVAVVTVYSDSYRERIVRGTWGGGGGGGGCQHRTTAEKNYIHRYRDFKFLFRNLNDVKSCFEKGKHPQVM